MTERIPFPSPDDIDSADSEIETAASRIPDPEIGLGSMNINSYIASLTNISRSYVHTNHLDRKERMDKEIGVAAYLRDEFNAQTVQDISNILTSGKVKPEVVKFWIEEELAVNPLEFDAILVGYPELGDLLQQVRDTVLDRLLYKNKE